MTGLIASAISNQRPNSVSPVGLPDRKLAYPENSSMLWHAEDSVAACECCSRSTCVHVMPATCFGSRCCTCLGGSAFGLRALFTSLTGSGVLARHATLKRIEWRSA